MPRVQSLAHPASWSGLFLALALTGCEQSTTTAPPAPPPHGSSQEIGVAVARAIALAMAETPIRQQVLNDLRESPYSEHKVILQDYLRSPGGTRLLEAIERAGIDSDSLSSSLQDTPPIQFYVPVTAQRTSWRGTPDILVVPNLVQAAPDVGFAPTGATQRLQLAQGLPSGAGAVFVLEWAEPMFRRWAGPTAATETIELEGESQIGSGRVERDASGRIVSMIDDTPEGGLRPNPSAMSIDSAGTWVDYINNLGVCDHDFCDRLELQFFTTSPGGDYGANLLTGIPGGSGSWSGWWKIHTLHASPANPIEVWLTETDNTSSDDRFYCGIGWGPCSVVPNPILEGTDGIFFAECVDRVCDADYEPNLRIRFRDRADPVLTTVTVSPATVSLWAGQTATLTATPRDQYGDIVPGKTASWITSNAAVATVASTGNLTASVRGVGDGQATITAAIDGRTGTSTVTVTVPPPSVSISGPQSLALHESGQYFANVSGGTAPYSYEWRSRNCGPAFGCGAWQNWFSTGSQNYTFASINSCGLNEIRLEARVTDSRNGVGYSPTYFIQITNPC